MQRQLALNDEVDIDGDSESSGCEQSSVGDSVAEVREIGNSRGALVGWEE